MFVILHGWAGNFEGHWQTWLAERLRARGDTVEYPTLPDFDEPQLDVWVRTFHDLLLDRDERVVAVCHSLAVITWFHLATRVDEQLVTRAVLVAPPSASSGIDELEGFFPVPLDPAAVNRIAGETLLVCADDDPYCVEGGKEIYGDPLRIDSIVLDGGAHLNVEAGYGKWPDIERWVTKGWQT
jgi:predicted alpha/beta hydrolase family esterase